MAPRNSGKSDDEIIRGAIRALGRHGARFTLAQVASEVDLTAARIVQRFGSKRGLLHAVARYTGKAGQGDLAALESAESPIRFLLDDLTRWSRQAGNPRELANHLSAFRFHLDDPVMRRLDTANYRAQSRRLKAILDRAVAVGELRRCNTVRLARTIVAVSTGSYFLWVGYERGDLGATLRRDILSVLEPHRANA